MDGAVSVGISATGLGSGLDIEGLVTQLVAAERAPIEQRLFRNEQKITNDISALGSLKSALSDLRSSTSAVSSPDTYSKRVATTTDATRISVTADATAALGSYDVEVTALASKQSIAIRHQFSSLTDIVGTGALTFTFGTTAYTADASNHSNDTYDSFAAKAGAASKSITIDSTNNTLSGLRDAINDADIGVTAAVVKEAAGYRLLLSSTALGAENSVEVTVADSGDSNHSDANGLSRLAFNSVAGTTNAYQTAAATDASFKINGLSLSSDSNTVSSVVDGLTLTFRDVTTASEKITVADNTSGIKGAINTFVEGYNAFVAAVGDLTSYDATTGVKGPLLGDFTARSLTNQLRTTLSAAADGYVGTYSRLAEIGISLSSTGSLAVDDTKLTNALDADFDNVSAVLARFAESSNSSGIKVSSFSDAVAKGSYVVSVSSLATNGKLSATVPSSEFPVTLDSSNDEFVLTVDGTSSGTIALTQQAYANLSAIASELQTKINADATLRAAGKAVTVSVSGDVIEIRSNSVGSSSSIALANAGSDSTVVGLGLALATGTAGTDLVGTINGIAGVATGNTLVGAVGSGAEGLSLDISSATGGTVKISNGVTNQFADFLDTMLGDDNALDDRISSLNSRAESLTEERAQMERRLDAIEKRYRLKFSALDSLLNELTTTSDFLTQQLKNIPVPGANKK